MRKESINIGILAVLMFIGFSTLLLSSFKEEVADKNLPCGDFLSMYAEKPEHLTFIKCERAKREQPTVRAIYRVSGAQSKPVEDFLVKRYDMAALRWVCCGWESMGKNGWFKHEDLTKIDPYLGVVIRMYASGEVEDKDTPGGVRLEFDRDKIEYFTIDVELIIV